MRQRFIGLALIAKNAAQGVVGFGVLGVDRESAAVAGGDAVQQFKVGANIGVGGFSVGGSYANEFDGKLTGVTGTTFGRSEEGQSYDVGVSYSTGPWGVSVTYFHGEWEAAPGGGDDEADAIVGGVSYALGPGITASGSILYGNFENENDGTVNAGSEGKATLGIVGLTVNF